MTDPAAVLALIPARGGSKGVPRKNLRCVGGQPLVVRAVRAALGARRVGRVVVSTDAAEIAEAARAAGAGVLGRPAEFASDEASSESALLHALDELERAEGYRPRLIAFVQCTAPLLRAEDIDGTLGELERECADSALAVTRTHGFLWRRGAYGGASGVNHDPCRRPRRQEREAEYLETGAVYAMRVDGFRAARHRFFGKVALYEMPRERVLEIDDEQDLRLAELLVRGAAPEAAALPDPVAALVFDFDGVFTDNRLLVNGDGVEAVACSREDGFGIGELRAAGMPMLVLSAERNAVVEVRCRKLGLECRSGVAHKLEVLRAWARERAIDLSRTVYLGNDRNDLECLEAVGCGVVVGDAHPSVLSAARIRLTRPGGQGAIRELSDLVLNHSRGALR